MIYYLYVKTHKITGLKYLGHTKQNPFFYRGSGKLWKKHIAEFGYTVTTEILLKTECMHCLRETGLFFSRIFDIVKSKDWANLIPEQGDDLQSINQTGKNLYGYNGKAQKSLEGLAQGRKTIAYLRMNNPDWVIEHKKAISESLKERYKISKHPWLGKKHSEGSIDKQKATYAETKHQKGEKNSQYGTMWISSLTEQKSKKHKKTDPIPEGWIKGRKFNFFLSSSVGRATSC
jgi:hypothetical protein